MNIKISLENRAKKALINSICLLLEKNPTKNVIKILNLSRSFSRNSSTKEIINIIENSYKTKTNFKEFIENSLESIDINILKKFIFNLTNNSYNDSNSDSFTPFSLLITPTSECNLSCEKSLCSKNNKSELTFRDVNKTVFEAKELGINCILIFGGEPFSLDFMYKIYQTYDDMIFVSFTNGTLINDSTAKKILELGNILPLISLDGFEEYTDNKCTKGTYNKILKSMKILKYNSIPFGINCTTTSTNFDEVTSDKFINMLISNGSLFTIYSSLFNCHYNLKDMINDTECKELEQKINYIRNTKPYFVIDLFNDYKYLEKFYRKSSTLNYSKSTNFEGLIVKDISKFNINKMTVKDMIKFT